MSSTLTIKKTQIEKKVQDITVKSFWMSLGEIRFDASFYAQAVSKATRLLEESGYDLITIGQLSKDVFTLGRVKRYYGDSNATPYLMPSALFDFPLSSKKHVYANKIKDVQRWFLKDGWLVITCSGKVGMPLIVTESYEPFIVSHDVARVIPEPDTLTGFLYAYLSSWVGYALLTKDQYGVAVDHIEPHHIKSVKVPILPEDVQKIIHKNILKVFKLREEARSLLAKSIIELRRELELPKLKKSAKSKSFSIKSETFSLRLDASYHNPETIKVLDRIKKCKYPSKRLRDNLAEVFIPGRFKRIYVDKNYGLPFLSGTQISQLKPYDLKYISTRVTKNIERWMVRADWILITCSGTIGRVSLVPEAWDNWAVSQHVLRVIPNSMEINTGFLTAFFFSEYGNQQIISKTYGGVVDELAEDDMRDVIVPVPPMDVQEKIGKLVLRAYEFRELANKIEDDTVKTLEHMLTKHQKKGDITEQFEVESYADTFDLLGDEEFRESLEQAKKGEMIDYDSEKGK